jgi:protoheme IX farnesyltransferase
MPLASTLRTLRNQCWPLIKARQTALLTLTGLAGFLSAHPPAARWLSLLTLAASLTLAISGSTVLNMWFDRDIDAKMARTSRRPLSSGLISPRAGFWLGTALAALGLGAALAISPLCAILALAGIFFELGIYTLWLKRRTPWSILWGGLAGGMPILGGRAVGLGHLDALGLLLALAVVLWIPTHNLTLNMLYADDYRLGGVPTFPTCYGPAATRRTIALASVLAALAMNAALVGAGASTAVAGLLLALNVGLLGLAAAAWRVPSVKWIAGLYKYASVYMVGCMLLLAVGAR